MHLALLVNPSELDQLRAVPLKKLAKAWFWWSGKWGGWGLCNKSEFGAEWFGSIIPTRKRGGGWKFKRCQGVMVNLLWSPLPLFLKWEAHASFAFSSKGNQEELFDKIMEGKFAFTSPFWDDVSSAAKVSQCITCPSTSHYCVHSNGPSCPNTRSPPPSSSSWQTKIGEIDDHFNIKDAWSMMNCPDICNSVPWLF